MSMSKKELEKNLAYARALNGEMYLACEEARIYLETLCLMYELTPGAQLEGLRRIAKRYQHAVGRGQG